MYAYTSRAPYPYPAYSNASAYPRPYCTCVPAAFYGIRSAWPNWPRDAQLRQNGQPLVVNIERAAVQNRAFRTVLWTGKHLQLTVMSIPVGQDIGLEVHPDADQFIRIEEGEALVQMGDRQDRLTFSSPAREDDAILIPAGRWHNVTNTGDEPLKVYVLYAPPQHPAGTVHPTKADAMAAER